MPALYGEKHANGYLFQFQLMNELKCTFDANQAMTVRHKIFKPWLYILSNNSYNRKQHSGITVLAKAMKRSEKSAPAYFSNVVSNMQTKILLLIILKILNILFLVKSI